MSNENSESALPRAQDPDPVVNVIVDMLAKSPLIRDGNYGNVRAIATLIDSWIAALRAARAGADAVRASRGEARVPHEETNEDARVEAGATTPSTGSTATNLDRR